jgi:hypothetical protein
MSRGRVLVVDDVEANRRLLLRMLDAIGHDVAEAGNGRQALELLRDPHADPIDVGPAGHHHARVGRLRDARRDEGRCRAV